MLVRHFAFKAADAARLAGRVTPAIYQEAVGKLMELLERFRTQAVKDRAAYTYRAMDALIKAHETVEADVVDDERQQAGEKKAEKKK